MREVEKCLSNDLYDGYFITFNMNCNNYNMLFLISSKNQIAPRLNFHIYVIKFLPYNGLMKKERG